MAGPGLRFPFRPPWPQTLACDTEHVSPLLKGEVSVSTLPRPPPHAAFPSPLQSLLLTDFFTTKSYHWAFRISKFNEKFQSSSCWISLYHLRGLITVSLKLPPLRFLFSLYTCQYFLFHLHGILSSSCSSQRLAFPTGEFWAHCSSHFHSLWAISSCGFIFHSNFLIPISSSQAWTWFSAFIQNLAGCLRLDFPLETLP